MALGPFISYVPPGVYTRTLTEVGYLSVYDRDLLTLLYDPRIKPGMSSAQARSQLPQVIAELGLSAGGGR